MPPVALPPFLACAAFALAAFFFSETKEVCDQRRKSGSPPVTFAPLGFTPLALPAVALPAVCFLAFSPVAGLARLAGCESRCARFDGFFRDLDNIRFQIVDIPFNRIQSQMR